MLKVRKVGFKKYYCLKTLKPLLKKGVLKVRNEKYVEEIKGPGLISIKKLKCKAKVMEGKNTFNKKTLIL